MRSRSPRVPAAELARLSAPTAAPDCTFGVYVDRWLARRAQVRPRSLRTDRQRLESYARPAFAGVPLADITAAWVRVWVARLAEDLAPRTVRHAYATLSWVLRDAVVDGIIPSTPCILGPADLPADADADPEWRAGFWFALDELAQLVSDPRVPAQRRVLWGLCGMAGMRIGEVAALRWSDLRRSSVGGLELFVARSFDCRERRMGATKTATVRRVPVHSTLARGLTWWHALGWAGRHGRIPRGEDLLVPTGNGTPVRGDNAAARMRQDLAVLGLRKGRSPHALRHTFLTAARAARCEPGLIRQVTHARSRDVVEGYSRTEWSQIAAEVERIPFAGEIAPAPVTEPEQLRLRFGGGISFSE
jgi:integrase